MMRLSWQLISLAAISIAIASCSSESTVTKTPAPEPTAAALPAPKEVWLSQFQPLNGTPYLYAPIYVAERESKGIIDRVKSASWDSYDGGKGYGGFDIRNYMFVHRDNLSANKLLANNNARILQMEQLGEAAPVDKSAKNPPPDRWVKTVKHLWYVTATNDTNSDKILNDNDRKQIAISDVSGTNYTEIIKNIDRILLVYPKGIERRLVIYSSGSKRLVADIDISKRQATVKELPALD